MIVWCFTTLSTLFHYILRWWKGDNESLCASHKLNSASSRIRTRDLVIQVGSANHSATRRLLRPLWEGKQISVQSGLAWRCTRFTLTHSFMIIACWVQISADIFLDIFLFFIYSIGKWNKMSKLLSWKNMKNVINSSSAEFAHTEVKIKKPLARNCIFDWLCCLGLGGGGVVNAVNHCGSFCVVSQRKEEKR